MNSVRGAIVPSRISETDTSAGGGPPFSCASACGTAAGRRNSVQAASAAIPVFFMHRLQNGWVETGSYRWRFADLDLARLVIFLFVSYQTQFPVKPEQGVPAP